MRKDSKKDPKKRSDSPHPKATSKPKDSSESVKESKEEKALCPGCGAWLSEKHTTGTCQWILQKRKGYNEHWKTTQWLDSEAGKKQMELGKEYLPRLKPLTEKKKAAQGTSSDNELSACDLCDSILNYISNISHNLPVIPSVIQY